MLIKYLYVDNYKALVNLKVEFSRINLLLGKNGAGKSSLLDVVRSLRSFVCDGKRVDEVFSSRTLTRWQKVNVQTFELAIESGKGLYVYRLVIEHNTDIGKMKVKAEEVTLDGKTLFCAEDGKARLFNDLFNEGPEILTDWTLSAVAMVHERLDNKLLTYFKRSMANIVVCSIYPVGMEDRAVRESAYPDRYFCNIADVCMSFLQLHPEVCDDLREKYKEVSPCFLRFCIAAKDGKKMLQFRYRVENTDITLYLSDLSDGEKALFALYFLTVCIEKLGWMLLLDEPDNYISTREVQPIFSMIEDATRDGNSQCIVTSHNSDVIDFWAAPYAVWFSRLDYGAVRVIDAPVTHEAVTYSQMIANGELDDIR